MCSVDGCDKKVRCRGWCNAHYSRWYRYGDPNTVVRVRNTCEFDGCERAAYGHGLCSTHWKQKRDGRPLAQIKPRAGWGHNKDRCCSFDGCINKMVNRGYCYAHSHQLKKYGVLRPVGEMRANGFNRSSCVDSQGYVHVWAPDHATAQADGYALEHRMVMSDYLNRPLYPNENVHHKNGDRSANHIDNLELWVTSQPAGQRVEDLVAWAQEILQRYAA